MPIGKSTPIRFSPVGLCDSYDSTDVFPGACQKLQNLVFDPSNPQNIIARPGVGAALTSFAGFSSPGFISVQITLGNLVFGMIASSLNSGKDQPFCYNLTTNTFVTISGITSATTPTSPATTGAWTPPTMAVIGVDIIVTHPGFSGTTYVFGVINISTLTAPTWTAQNLNTNALPSVPTAVANFNNRAYFAIGNKLYYSDVLNPLNAANAGQSLTLGDSTSIVALSGLPIQTTTAGVTAALLAFKSTQIWQVTGDAAITNTLAENYLSLNIGTNSPRSVASSPIGVFFVGPDTAYLVSPFALPIPVTNIPGSPNVMPDLRQPFINSSVPSRIAAAFASNVYRVCGPSIVNNVVGTFDYWFDTRRMRWNGPHTFAYDSVSSAGNYFILSGVGTLAQLYASYVTPQTSQSYVDISNSQPYLCDMKSSEFPKRNEMAMKQVVESTMEFTPGLSSTIYTITAYNEQGQTLSMPTITTATNGNFWGKFLWGDGTRWSSTLQQPNTFNIPWTQPLIFNQMSIEITATAGAYVSMGTFYARTQLTGYTLQVQTS